MVPALSIAENIALGDLPVRGCSACCPRSTARRMREEAQRYLDQLNFERRSRPAGHVAGLRRAPARGHRQGAAPAMPHLHPGRADRGAGRPRDRAAVRRARAHEGSKAPPSSISRIGSTRSSRLADRCTVLRDGRLVAVRRARQLLHRRPVEAMTGTMAQEHLRSDPLAPGEPLLEETADASPTA